MADLQYGLLLACEEGNFDSVQHFVEEYGADVNAANNYNRRCGYSYSKIGGVTPLFVASLMGNIDIVRYLISKAANVSAMTHTEDYTGYGGLTPLYGAFMERRPRQTYSEKYAESSIIANLLLTAGANPSAVAPDGTPVWMRDWCGYDAIIALVNFGLDTSQRNAKRETMLHYCLASRSSITEEEKLPIIQLLADHDSNLMMIRDKEGFTPILRAAQKWDWNLLDWMLERDDIAREEKIDALELAGSFLLFLSYNPDKGIGYWRQALALRGATEERVAINKILLPAGQAEWVTLTDLENLFEEPSEYLKQSLLTGLRICSNRSLAALEDFFSLTQAEMQDSGDYNCHYDPTYADEDDEGDFDRPEKCKDQNLVSVMLAFLETIPRFHPDDPLRWALTESVLQKLLERLWYDDPFFNVERFAASMRLIIAADPDGRATPPYSYGFFKSLAGLPETKLNEDIKNHLSQSVRHESARQENLIPFACLHQDLNTLRLLLHLRADPNLSNYENGPLHVLAGMDETHLRSAAANLLFSYGAQPYRTNDEGETAVDIWRKENCGEEGIQSAKWKNRPYWCRDTVPMLKNLSAKTIHINRISYDTLPPLLHSFVKEH